MPDRRSVSNTSDKGDRSHNGHGITACAFEYINYFTILHLVSYLSYFNKIVWFYFWVKMVIFCSNVF